MPLANLALFRGDAGHIVRVFLHQIGVEVVQSTAHLVGVLLVNAKNDSLGKSVRASHELGQMARNGLGAGAQGDDAIEVLGMVFLIGHLPAIAIHLALAGPPTGGIRLGDDTMNPIGCEEAVIDPLA